jgi:TolB-like protein
MKILGISFSFLAVLLFTGCSASFFENKSPCGTSSFGAEYSHAKIDFASMMSSAVSKISSQAGERYGLKKEVIVTDFVSVEALSNKTQLGFIFSSNLKNELAANRKLKIIEAQTAKYFKIGDDGVTLLSRDKSDSLRDEFGADYAFVGTYAVTEERIIVFVKLINLSTGKIEAAATEEEPMSCEIKNILDLKSKKIL